MKIISFILFTIILVNAAGCATNKITADRKMKLPAFNLEGHRGIRGLSPENTIPSFIKAIDYGVQTIELDVVISKDKKVVVSHDIYFNPDITTTPEGTIMSAKDARERLLFQMDYDSIKKYDVGIKPYKLFPQQEKIRVYKPLMTDVIDEITSYLKKSGKSVMFNIELKSSPDFNTNEQPPVEEMVRLVMEIVEQKKLLNKCYIQSFDFRAMRIVHENYPAYTTAILIGSKEKRTLDEQLKELGYVPEIYSPSFNLVDEKLLEACHRYNMKLIPWTVNTAEDMRKLIGLGVDGLITDYANIYIDLKK